MLFLPPGIIANRGGATAPGDLVPAGLLSKVQNWWPMEDESSTLKSDVHGTDHLNGANINWLGVDGLHGYAADFNETTDFLDTPDDFLTEFEKFAMIIWCYPTAKDSSDLIAYSVQNNASSANVNGDWQLRHSTNDGVVFIISNDGSWNDGDGERIQLCSTADWTLNEWHMIAIMADPDTREIKASYDAGPLQSLTVSYNFFNNGRTIRFGQLTSSFPNTFIGGMDEVVYLTDFLTQEDVTWFWNDGAGRQYSEVLGPANMLPPDVVTAYNRPNERIVDVFWDDAIGEDNYEIQVSYDDGATWAPVGTNVADDTDIEDSY